MNLSHRRRKIIASLIFGDVGQLNPIVPEGLNSASRQKQRTAGIFHPHGLVEPRIPKRLDEMIAQQLELSRVEPDSRLKTIENQLRDSEKRIQNLLRTLESGEGSHAIAARIRQLESEKKALVEERLRLQSAAIGVTKIRNAAQEAAAFVFDFKKRFDSASSMEQKVMMRRVVKELVVDRQNDTITCNLYRIPQIPNPLIAQLQRTRTSLQDCARNRTYSLSDAENETISLIDIILTTSLTLSDV